MVMTEMGFYNNSLSPHLLKRLFCLCALFYRTSFTIKPMVDKTLHGKISKLNITYVCQSNFKSVQ